MVKITNGRQILTVSAGAYRNFFRGLGYKPVEAPESHENPGQDSTHGIPEEPVTDTSGAEGLEETPEEEPGDEEDSPLSEIPLSEMTMSQLLEYAEELGLEYEGNPSRKELRKLIRDHLK